VHCCSCTNHAKGFARSKRLLDILDSNSKCNGVGKKRESHDTERTLILPRKGIHRWAISNSPNKNDTLFTPFCEPIARLVQLPKSLVEINLLYAVNYKEIEDLKYTPTVLKLLTVTQQLDGNAIDEALSSLLINGVSFSFLSKLTIAQNKLQISSKSTLAFL